MQHDLTLSPEQQQVEDRLTKLSIRDAKGLSAELKETLKRRDINDRQLQLQTQTLRQAYLDLIFSPSLGSLTQADGTPAAMLRALSSTALARRLELLNLLWLDTSHAVIQVFRSKVSAIDKAIAEAPRAHRNGPGGGGARGGPSVPGPAARRKLIHAFRQFLTGEEDFFRALVGRLAAGGLAHGDVEGLRSLGVMVDLVDPATGKEWGWDDDERRKRREITLPLAHKALICFGDLARYKELYNEPGATPVNPLTGAGGGKRGDSRGRRGARGGGGGGQLAKTDSHERSSVKNYARAAECYTQARLLLPEHGNPSNQLAVLAQYAADPLASTYHYYRALTVKQPFPTARTNLDITYSKQLAKWTERDEDGFERDQAERFRAAFVALQAVFFKARTEEAAVLAGTVEQLFRIAVEGRLLTSDVIVKVVVTSLCSLWNARMQRSPPPEGKPGTKSTSSKPRSASPSAFAAIEPFVFLHVLSLYRVLLTAATAETNELVSQNDADGARENALAQNISAVLRRISPALRILSKYLTGQLEYIHRAQARLHAREQREGGGAGPASLSSTEFAAEVDTFWRAYAAFGSSITKAFPQDKLPTGADVWLEEDVELLGFSPLKKGIRNLSTAADGGSMQIARVGTDVHPNDEQLIRIADIQRDALAMVASNLAPVNATAEGLVCTTPAPSRPIRPLTSGSITLPEPSPVRKPVVVPTMPSEDGEEEYQMTEDDPVDLAMRVGAADKLEMESNAPEGDDLDEDGQLYANMSGSSQLLKPASASHSTLLPPSAPAAAQQPQNSAQLLLNLLQGAPPTKTPSATASPVGSSPPIGPGRNIWAPTETSRPVQPSPPAPITRDSFEALPNTTTNQSHLSSQYGTPATWGQPAQHGTPSPLGYGQQQSHYGQQYQHQYYQQQQQHAHQPQYSTATAYSAPAPAAPQPSSASASASFFNGAFSPFSPQTTGQQLPPSAPASWTFQPNTTATGAAQGAGAAYAGFAQGHPYPQTSAVQHTQGGYSYQGFG